MLEPLLFSSLLYRNGESERASEQDPLFLTQPRHTASPALPPAYSKTLSCCSGYVPDLVSTYVLCMFSGWTCRCMSAQIISDSHGVLYAVSLRNAFFLTLSLYRPGLTEAGWIKGSASYWPTSQRWGLSSRHSHEHLIESGTKFYGSTEVGAAGLARGTKRASRRRCPVQRHHCVHASVAQRAR